MKSRNWLKVAGVIGAIIVLLFSIKAIGNWASKENNDKEDNDTIGIQSESVEVYVQDVCITPQTLQFMAANNGIELIQMEDSSATFEIVNDEQRIVLYEELSKMGRVEETGDNIGGNQVKVVIISVSDETGGD